VIGGLALPEHPLSVEHRGQLIYLLREAAELEHGIMCQYLFTAFSLKQSTGEGLTDEQLQAVNRCVSRRHSTATPMRWWALNLYPRSRNTHEWSTFGHPVHRRQH
jgi:hypothetical protein